MKRSLVYIVALCAVLVTLVSIACAPHVERVSPATTAEFPALTGPYLGQSPPGRHPELFAPGIVSTGLAELNSVFTPDGKEFYYAVDIGMDWVIMVTRERNGTWSTPEVASFSREDSAVDLSISADGQRLFYCSNRSRSGSGEREHNLDIWYVDRTEDGEWSEPTNLAAINSDSSEFYPSVTADGTLYFLSGRDGGLGRNDIYRSQFANGEYAEPENLGPVVNTPGGEGDAFIAPDESYIIFNSSGHKRGPADGSLFISYRSDDATWSTPRNLSSAMQADRSDFCPMLSPDGKYFFFSSARPRFADSSGHLTWVTLTEAQSRPENGNTDIYWISADFIRDGSLAP
ncbi:MAG: hypothetical protein GY906_33445 [bacterium]|nr:hypothetical protein [bacterium]